jgi:hypothetical protein
MITNILDENSFFVLKRERQKHVSPNAEAICRPTRHSRPESSNQTPPVRYIHINPHKGTAVAITLGTACLPSSKSQNAILCRLFMRSTVPGGRSRSNKTKLVVDDNDDYDDNNNNNNSTCSLLVTTTPFLGVHLRAASLHVLCCRPLLSEGPFQSEASQVRFVEDKLAL